MTAVDSPSPPAVEVEIMGAQIQRLITLVDDLYDRFDTVDTCDTRTGRIYADVGGWVDEHLLAFLERQPSSQHRWCTTWREHPEAVARLTACWHAWEHLRIDGPLGLSNWFRDHLDPCLHAIMAPTGPFAACTPARHARSGPCVPERRCS